MLVLDRDRKHLGPVRTTVQRRRINVGVVQRIGPGAVVVQRQRAVLPGDGGAGANRRRAAHGVGAGGLRHGQNCVLIGVRIVGQDVAGHNSDASYSVKGAACFGNRPGVGHRNRAVVGAVDGDGQGLVGRIGGAIPGRDREGNRQRVSCVQEIKVQIAGVEGPIDGQTGGVAVGIDGASCGQRCCNSGGQTGGNRLHRAGVCQCGGANGDRHRVIGIKVRHSKIAGQADVLRAGVHGLGHGRRIDDSAKHRRVVRSCHIYSQRAGCSCALRIRDGVVEHLGHCGCIVQRLRGRAAVVQHIDVAAVGLQIKRAIGAVDRGIGPRRAARRRLRGKGQSRLCTSAKAALRHGQPGVFSGVQIHPIGTRNTGKAARNSGRAANDTIFVHARGGRNHGDGRRVVGAGDGDSNGAVV